MAWGEWETEKIQIVKQLRARRTLSSLSSLSSFVCQLETEEIATFKGFDTAAGVRLWRLLTVMVLGKLQRSVELWGGEDLEHANRKLIKEFTEESQHPKYQTQ